MGADTVKIFCPKCNHVYHPPPLRGRAGNASGVDGAAFGTTFAHLFLMTFSNLVPDPLPAESAYVPRVFGFRVHKTARQREQNLLGAQAAAAAAAAAAPAAFDRQQKSTPAPGQAPISAIVAADAADAAIAAAAAAVNAPDPQDSPVAPDGAATGPAAPGDSLSRSAAAAAAAAGDDKQQSSSSARQSGTKRRNKESAQGDGNLSRKPEGNGSGPSFFLENTVKRRKRNGST